MVICLTKYLLSGDKHQLSKIWLAAHWEKKIKKTQIFEVDIERSIQDIMEAEIILDLRISGHLLVGIVKIHSRKTKYLLTECSSIFYQIKVFHSGGIDLPHDKQTAHVNEITLDDGLFDNIDIENDVIDAIFTNQSRIEDITLKETYGRLSLLDDADMVDFAFHEEDEPFENFEDSLILLNESLDNPEDLSVIRKGNEISVSKHVKNPSYLNIADGRKIDALHVCNEEDELDLDIFNSHAPEFEIPETIEVPASVSGDTIVIHNQLGNSGTPPTQVKQKTDDNLTLEPVETSTKSISINRVKSSSKLRKRKACVDRITCMSYKVVKKHIQDTTDISSVLELAPSSKRLMNLKEIGSAVKLFCLPVIKLQNSKLLKLYQRNLKTHQSESFESLSEDEEFHHVRKRSKGDSLDEIAANESVSENFDATPVSPRRSSMHVNVDNDMPALDNIMIDAELGNQSFTETGIPNLSFPETAFDNYDIPANDVNDDQSTPVSKTSEERWECAFQNKISEMLHCLKLLFQENSVICFSSLTKNCKKLQVSRKFLCLLMLKKFQVISLEQSGAFKEVFISPDLNFDSACQKFCSS